MDEGYEGPEYDQQGWEYSYDGYGQDYDQQGWAQAGWQQGWSAQEVQQPANAWQQSPFVQTEVKTKNVTEVAQKMKETKTYYSTLGSILLSVIDFVLHCMVAIWLTYNHWGEHQAYWSFIVLALIANLVGILVWILQNAQDTPATGGESEFTRKLRETPNEVVCILGLSIINTESACFLTGNPHDQRTFRVLDMLRTLFEDVPLVWIQFSFLVDRGTSGNELLMLSLFVTTLNVLLKFMRALILKAVGAPNAEPKLDFFQNTRHEDWILAPVYMTHFVLFFILLVFFENTSGSTTFAHRWLGKQLTALGGLNASDALEYALSNSTLISPLDLQELTILAQTAQNDSHKFGNCTAPPPPALPPYPPPALPPLLPPPSHPPLAPGEHWAALAEEGEAGSGELGSGLDQLLALATFDSNATNYTQGPYLCALTIETLVARVLLPRGNKVDRQTLAMSRRWLSPAGQALIVEWGQLQERLHRCFVAGLLFFIGGCFSSIGLLMRYLKHKSYSELFRTTALVRSSLTSATITACSMMNGGFLNALTQDRLSYSIVKRDASICHMAFFGFPVMSVAAAALGGFNCQHRACDLGFAGQDVEYYMTFMLVICVPLVWWHFLSFLTASVAVRSTSSTEQRDQLPTEEKQLDELHPPIEDKGYLGKRNAAIAFGCSSVKWLCQLMLLLVLFWNSRLAMRTIGGKLAREWLELDEQNLALRKLAGAISAPITLWVEGAEHEIGGKTMKNITRVEEVDTDYFNIGASVFVLGMIINVVAVGLYLAYRSTPALRRAVEQQLALTAAAFTLSVIHPEAMRSLADRRADVMVLRALGALPAVMLDAPILALAMRFLLEHGYNGFVVAVAILSLAHLLLYFARAVIVIVTSELRREAERDPSLQRFSPGDLLTQVASTLQFGLCCALVGLYYHGWMYGKSVGFKPDQVDACASAFYAAAFVVVFYLISSFGMCVSFLNHFEFSHTRISERSYLSAVILVLGTIDGSWLTFLAEDAVAVREVKRAAAVVAIATFFLPMLLLQGVMVFMSGAPLHHLDGPNEDLLEDLQEDDPELGSGYELVEWDRIISGSAVQNAAMGLTVVVGVWKLLLLVILHTTTQQTAGASKSPFVHTPWVLGEQWLKNRKPSAAFLEAQQRANRRKNGRPTHHMGYAIDADGNYTYDADGNFILGPGVSYTYDDHGNYVSDDFGNYVLQDADCIVIGEGYGDDGYGGYLLPDELEGGATEPADGVTNTSRSTDTYIGGQSAEPSEIAPQDVPRPAEMWWASCARKALYTWEGVQGVFVALHTMEQPYLFVQVHEVQDVKKSFLRGKKGDEQVRVSYLSVEVGSLDREYVEQNIVTDTQTAVYALGGGDGEATVDDGLAVDSYEASAAVGGEYGEEVAAAGGYGRRGEAACATPAQGATSEDTAQRL